MVKIPFDTAFRCFFKFFVVYFYFGNLAVTRENFVHRNAVFLHYLFDFVGQSLFFGVLEIRVNQCYEFSLLLDDDRLVDVGQIIDFGFDFFWVDILSRGSQNHAFAASFEVDVVVIVDDGEVAGVEPAVFQHGIGSFLVFVVSQHHAVSLDMQFADDAGGVGRVDAGFRSVY